MVTQSANVKTLTNAMFGVLQNKDSMKTHPSTNCIHAETEKRFVGYHFTLELYAKFCKHCDVQITEPIAE